MKTTLPCLLLVPCMLLAGGAPALAQSPTNFYTNPLMVNGYPLDLEMFTVYSQGILTVVEGDPAVKPARPVAFRVYLRRAGIIVRRGPSNETNAVYSVQLHELFQHVRFGDELVIEPLVGGVLVPSARQVIKLKAMYNWLAIRNVKEGC